MEGYKNIQNPQLYQQILEEERRRRAIEADQKITSSNLHNQMMQIKKSLKCALPKVACQQCFTAASRRGNGENFLYKFLCSNAEGSKGGKYG